MFARSLGVVALPLRRLVPATQTAVRFVRRQRMQKEHYAGLKSNLLDHLDIDRDKKKADSDSQVSKTARKKINLTLDTPDKEVVDSIAHSIMDTNGYHICEIMNDAIEKPSFDIKIAEMHQTMGLSIEEVVETVDRGKVTAYWVAPQVDKFIEFAKFKDAKSSRRMNKLVRKNISEMLQKCEPRFRAYLIKKMDFRRVPKIDFAPMIDQEKNNDESDARQAFLREQARASYDTGEDDLENITEDDYYAAIQPSSRPWHYKDGREETR
jgi:ribosome-binding factor A